MSTEASNEESVSFPPSPATQAIATNEGLHPRARHTEPLLAPPPSTPQRGSRPSATPLLWMTLGLLFFFISATQLRRESPLYPQLHLVASASPLPQAVAADADMVGEGGARQPVQEVSTSQPYYLAEMEDEPQVVPARATATATATASSSSFASGSGSASGSPLPSAAGSRVCVLLGAGSRLMRNHAAGVAPLVLAPINHLHVQVAYHPFLRGIAAADPSITPANAPPAGSGRFQFPRLYNRASLWFCNISSLQDARNMHAAEPLDVHSAIIVDADEFNPASRKFDGRARHNLKCVRTPRSGARAR